MVGHLDAVGLHGVARAIIKVAHVRVLRGVRRRGDGVKVLFAARART